MVYPSTVYLNGQYISKDKAVISPDDRGFYFADGVYEVIKYYKGNPFRLNEHLNRLKNSLAGIRIQYERVEELAEIGSKLININQRYGQFSGIYIQITRGAASRSHCFPINEVKPTVYCYSFDMPMFENEVRNGVFVITREDIRWNRCNIKSIALLPNTLLFQEACEKGAFECLLIRDGLFTEATHSNIIFVKNGSLFSHPDTNLILPGITKSAVFELSRSINIQVIEEPVRVSDYTKFDECFITGTGSEITPVVKIDDHVIGNGNPGPVTKKLQHAFFKITYEQLAGDKIII
jgi:D-alanine transaminase